MSTTSKSPRKVLLVAYAAAQEALPRYAHHFAPKKFTQPQLFACLVLKVHQKKDYRGLCALLADSPDLCQAIDLKAVPHWTTLQKAADRLLRTPKVLALLEATLTLTRPRRRVRHAAADSSGLETHHASRYFVWRSQHTTEGKQPKKRVSYRKFGKLMLLVCCASHLALAAVASTGPTPDVGQLDGLLANLSPCTTIERLVADAGFDSAHNHRLLREEHGIVSTIPPKHGRPSKDGRLPTDPYRRRMRTHFNQRAYRHRPQVETAFSMLKRNYGSSLQGRSPARRGRDLMLRVLTHNIAILLRCPW